MTDNPNDRSPMLSDGSKTGDEPELSGARRQANRERVREALRRSMRLMIEPSPLMPPAASIEIQRIIGDGAERVAVGFYAIDHNTQLLWIPDWREFYRAPFQRGQGIQYANLGTEDIYFTQAITVIDALSDRDRHIRWELEFQVGIGRRANLIILRYARRRAQRLNHLGEWIPDEHWEHP